MGSAGKSGADSTNAGTTYVSDVSQECRPSQGVCDAADFCDGVGKQCPVDAKEPVTTECRGSAGACASDAPFRPGRAGIGQTLT
jgi:hypothetical protein